MDQKHGNPPPPLNPPLRRARIRDPKTTRLHDKGIHPRTQPRRLAAPPADYRRFGTHDQRFRPPYRTVAGRKSLSDQARAQRHQPRPGAAHPHPFSAIRHRLAAHRHRRLPGRPLRPLLRLGIGAPGPPRKTPSGRMFGRGFA